MKNKIKGISKLILIILIPVFLISLIVYAGSLTPQGEYGSDEAKMYTLTDIYNRIVDGTEATKGGEDPSSVVDSTMYTLEEIYDAIPEHKDSIMGEDNRLTLNIPNGIYKNRKCIASSTTLLPQNIRYGVNIFGITGALKREEVKIEWFHDCQNSTWAYAISCCSKAGGRLPTIQELSNGLATQFIDGKNLDFKRGAGLGLSRSPLF